MAFTLETGAGLADSNTYAAVATADSYLTDRGAGTAWSALTTAQKQVALIKASDYIDAKFYFTGSRKNPTQAMAWPREAAFDKTEGVAIADNVVPKAVERCCIELASKTASGEILIEDLDRGGMFSSVSVGNGAVSLTYQDGAPTGKVFGIASLLKGLLVDKIEQEAITSMGYFYEG